MNIRIEVSYQYAYTTFAEMMVAFFGSGSNLSDVETEKGLAKDYAEDESKERIEKRGICSAYDGLQHSVLEWSTIFKGIISKQFCRRQSSASWGLTFFREYAREDLCKPSASQFLLQ